MRAKSSAHPCNGPALAYRRFLLLSITHDDIAGIFVGLQSSSHTSSPDNACEEARDELTDWRRKSYPAGRILHLVPARLVPGTRCI